MFRHEKFRKGAGTIRKSPFDKTTAQKKRKKECAFECLILNGGFDNLLSRALGTAGSCRNMFPQLFVIIIKTSKQPTIIPAHKI